MVNKKTLYIIVLSQICLYLLGFYSGFEYNKNNDNKLKIELYNMINKVNFESRAFIECSDNATFKHAIGRSMFYYAWDGGQHYSDQVSYQDIQIGDIITYEKNNKTIHHAVINKYNDRLYTAGYNNNNIDREPVYPDEILGRDCFMMKK